MIAEAARSLFLVFAIAVLAAPGAWARTASFQGAWLEEGQVCANVFVVAGKALGFKRPANAFAAAFIIRGQQLSTPLATCRIGRISPQGERQVMHLSCTTTIATDTARAVFAPAQDGGLYRYSTAEGGTATRYRRCTADALKTH
ncbi:putative protein OS=Bosea thiooxidans OX=53254 GN=SAMN05660750_03400 PE=4 SV=1 [Bosea thiooxidans]|uniref:Uncharacterized protein n=1 Tax=Bosea thiooxidans TaxID=53254 RepID=A0A1T5FNH5_9HYPH|nr:hypothetical protein [Bosea thiooxidans]SKB97688.1 hypothetical protein SAMN05660750_03400 [Bosea thiooxidans]